MIVLIAPEQDLNGEIEILNDLFAEGLRFYHLRKPGKSKDEIRAYLNSIRIEYHKYVVLHQFHELTQEFQLKGIHLQEQKRKELKQELGAYIEIYRQSDSSNFTISSSFHEVVDLMSCFTNFDYHLLSPVFSSISKKGYDGRGFNVRKSEKSIIGMGGVNEDTIQQIKELGFSGIGVLGGVWNSNDCVKAFRLIRDKHAQVFQT